MNLQKYLRLFRLKQAPNHCTRRTIFSKTGIWDEKYTANHRKELELFWKESFSKRKSKATENKPKYYVLSMFPYPSGKLHMGHVRVYTISDVMAHYKKLLGYNVIHPMGWDAFGLPAENAAIEQNVKPATWTKSNIEVMRKQLSSLGCQFEWDREISTCDASYYKWTQHLFLKLHDAGLVYQKVAMVNWDPVDRTVLADEQVDEEGRSWRSGARVEKVPLKQWYIRTTAYSKSLYDGLSEVDEELWKDIISLQKNWIGECNGARFDFKLKSNKNLSEADEGMLSSPLGVFTEHPEALFGASHVVLSQKHVLNQPKFYESPIESKGIHKLSISAVNPFSRLELPLFVDKEFAFGDHVDHHVGIPSISEDDRSFATKHELPFREVVDEHSKLVLDSDDLTGLTMEEAKLAILKKAKSLGVGGHVTSAKSRDWLISRQRYWGTPIPIIHCPKYGPVPVNADELPVLLPNKISLSSSSSLSSSADKDGDEHQSVKSPLANNRQWLEAKCSKCDCGGHGLRETDTMDTFVDSSWYFLRYLDPNNDSLPFDPLLARQFMPVDIYIGGKEHATMHLYYARFIHHFLYDRRMTPTREPFKNLLTQGMILGRSFRLSDSGKYLRPENVEKSLDGDKFIEKGTGKEVITEWEKMSKSKYNGVDPQEVLNEFGCDATRICILSNASPKSDRPWSNDVFVGVERWQKRLWSLVGRFVSVRTKAAEFQAANEVEAEKLKMESSSIDDSRNRILLQVKFHMDVTFLLNTAISRLQMLSSELTRCSEVTIAHSTSFERALSDLIIMLSPIAPMFTSELWAGIASVDHLNKHYDWDLDVLDQKYPEADKDFHLPLVVKVNRRELTEIRLPMVHSEMESQLTSELAWSLVAENEKFQELVSSFRGENGKDITWESHILSRKLTKHGGSKAEFEIVLNDKSSKKKKVAKTTG